MAVTEKEIRAALDDELLLVVNSGEIPEVAYHASLHYLTTDAEGPGLELSASDLLPLKLAVRDRYRRILLRDLDPGLRDKRVYRGLARAVANWQRLAAYCRREGFDLDALRREAAERLETFLRQELADVASGQRSSVNCSERELKWLLAEVGADVDSLPGDWTQLCPCGAFEPEPASPGNGTSTETIRSSRIRR